MTKNQSKNHPHNLKITPKLNTKLKCVKISQKMDSVVMEKNADLLMVSTIWKNSMIPKLILIVPESVNLFGYSVNVPMAPDANFLTLNANKTKICYQFAKMLFVKRMAMDPAVDCSQF